MSLKMTLKSILLCSCSVLSYLCTANTIAPLGWIDPEFSISGNSDYIFTENNHGIYKINIGRFDSPCPSNDAENRNCYQPNKEPNGISRVNIAVSTLGGGTLSFKYKLSSYDSIGASVNDHVNINYLAPNGNLIDIERNWTSPNRKNGTLWESGEKSAEIRLSAFKESEQVLTLNFSLYNDGWGDQSHLEIWDLKISGCDLSMPLITDPEALEYENLTDIQRAQLGRPKLKDETEDCLDCLEYYIESWENNNLIVTATYLPTTYLSHVFDVWTLKEKLNLDPDAHDSCSVELKDELNREMINHGLYTSFDRPIPSLKHATGEAFDAKVEGLLEEEFDFYLGKCRIEQKGRNQNHFEAKESLSNE